MSSHFKTREPILINKIINYLGEEIIDEQNSIFLHIDISKATSSLFIINYRFIETILISKIFQVEYFSM